VIDQSTHEIEAKIGDKYSLCIVAARRARQLKAGYPPLVEPNSPNPLGIAMAEIAAGKVIGLQPEELPVTITEEEPSIADLLGDLAGIHEETDEEDDKLISLDEELAQASAALGALEDQADEDNSDETDETAADDETEADDSKDA